MAVIMQVCPTLICHSGTAAISHIAFITDL